MAADAGHAKLAAKLGMEVAILPDNRFIADHGEFERWADGKKQLRMEFFYREMRRKTGLLMEGDEPLGGQWNYDSENRKKLPKGHMPPPRLHFPPDEITQNVLHVVKTHFGNHVGTLDKFAWPVTAAQAQEQLDHWLDFCLPQFGDYQDAMKSGEAFLYHGLVGASINLGLLDPLSVCRQVEARYHDGQAPLNAVEGFIRQILGWREFIRGLYWLKMPLMPTAIISTIPAPCPIFIIAAKPIWPACAKRLAPRATMLMRIIFNA